MTPVEARPSDQRHRRSRRLATAVSGNVVYALAQAAALAVVTRSQGGATDAADFLLGQAVATPLAVFVGGRVRDRLATEGAPAPLRFRLQRIGVMSGLALLVGSIGWVLFTDGQRTSVGIAILVANLAQIMANVFQGQAIRNDRFAASSLVNSGLGVLSLLSFVVGYQLGGLTSGAVLLAGSWSLLGAVLLSRCDGHSSDGGKPPELQDDLLVGLAATAMVAQPSAARIGVTLADSASGLATFGTTSTLARLGSLLVNGAKAAISPDLGAAVKAGTLDTYLLVLRRRLRLAVSAFMIVGAVGGAVLGPDVVELVFSDAVRPEAVTAALIFGLAPALYAAMLLSQVAIAGNRSKRLTTAALAGLMATAATVFPLAAAFGPTGAALALGLGNLIRYGVLDQVLLRPSGSEGTS